MVEIYVGSIEHLFKRVSVGLQLNNNAWFDQRFCDEITITAEMAYMIEKIEGGESIWEMINLLQSLRVRFLLA